MPVTKVKTPSGEVVSVQHPEGATQAKIIQYAKDNYQSLERVEASQEAPEPKEETGTLDFLLDQMKSEVGQMATNILPSWAQKLATGGRVDPMKEMREQLSGEEGPIDTRSVREREVAQAQRGNVFAEETIGYEGIQPKDELERYMGIGARALGDPTNLVGMGGRTIPAKLISGGMEYLYGAMSMVTGAMVGEQVQEALDEEGAPQWASDIASQTAAILTGATLNASRTPTGALIKGTYKGIKGAKGAGDKFSDYIASSEVQSVIKNAAQAEGGELGARIKTAEGLMDTFPGLVIPTAAAAGSNPIINKNFAELYAKYPDFRARYDKAQKNALGVLYKATEDIRNGVDINQKALRERVAGVSADEIQKADTLYKKREKVLDERLGKLADRLTSKTTEAEIGKAAQGVMDAKEAAVRASTGPKYKAAINDAIAKGYEFPSESVAAIYKAVKDTKAADIFATFPGMTGKIKSVWSPKEVEAFDYSTPGPAKKTTKMEFDSASIKDADSLKRAINKAMRGNRDDQQLRVLRYLKDTVATEMNKLPDDFVKAYRDVDSEYAQKLGFPRGTEGVKALDRARFETSVGTQLNKYDQASDYLNWVGDDGVPVVRDALMLAAERAGAVSADGEINTKSLGRFVRRNEATIDLVPGLKNELSNIRTAADAIKEVGVRIDSDYKAKALEYTEGFYQAVKKENLDTVAGKMLKPEARKLYLKEIKNMPADVGDMAMTGVRQALLNKAVQSSGTMYDYVQKNAEAFKDVFGPSYVKDLDNISKAFDIIRVMEGSKGASARDFADEDFLKKRTGVTAAETIGMLRNQILSPQRKAINLGSKMFLRKSAVKRDKSLMDLMVDVKGIKEIGDAAAKVEAASRAGATSEKLWNASKEFLITTAGRGVKGGTLASNALEELALQDEARESP